MAATDRPIGPFEGPRGSTPSGLSPRRPKGSKRDSNGLLNAAPAKQPIRRAQIPHEPSSRTHGRSTGASPRYGRRSTTLSCSCRPAAPGSSIGCDASTPGPPLRRINGHARRRRTALIAKTCRSNRANSRSAEAVDPGQFMVGCSRRASSGVIARSRTRSSRKSATSLRYSSPIVIDCLLKIVPGSRARLAGCGASAR